MKFDDGEEAHRSKNWLLCKPTGSHKKGDGVMQPPSSIVYLSPITPDLQKENHHFSLTAVTPLSDTPGVAGDPPEVGSS